MPSLNIDRAELEQNINSLLSTFNGSFDFNSFTGALARYFIKEGKGFAVKSNTQYTGDLQQRDRALVREIIWDLIILRYLTPGGNGHDEWPSLTITSKGTDFFATIKP